MNVPGDAIDMEDTAGTVMHSAYQPFVKTVLGRYGKCVKMP